MNYVEVMGGLGNQLFQYTFQKYCEKKTGCDTFLHTEFFRYVKDLDGATNRDFKLGKYKCEYVGISGNITCSEIIEEETFKGLSPSLDRIFFRGYWQKKEFFEEVKPIVLQELCLKDEYITKDVSEAAREIQECNSVAVHFRRGDYLNAVNSSIFCTLTLDYYKEALSHITNALGEDVKVFIFTDDRDYVSEIADQLGSMDKKIMPAREDYEDLYLMSLARHHIIANSTFSWWGSALSKYENGITVAPKNWFLDRPAPDIYLDGWVVL